MEQFLSKLGFTDVTFVTPVDPDEAYEMHRIRGIYNIPKSSASRQVSTFKIFDITDPAKLPAIPTIDIARPNILVTVPANIVIELEYCLNRLTNRVISPGLIAAIFYPIFSNYSKYFFCFTAHASYF